MLSIADAQKKEEQALGILKKENPDFITAKKIRLEKDVFKEIGIWNMSENREKGFLRRYLEDFIVEERNQQGYTSKINNINTKIPEISNDKTKILHTQLSKINIGTNSAVERVRESLKIKKQIGLAGLKDERAITSQMISLPRVYQSVEELQAQKISNLHLSNFQYLDGFLRPGYLEGNLFTITLRTEKKINEQVLKNSLDIIEKFGVLNYYQNQRFGGIRLESHNIGRLILQGNYEGAVKNILFATNDFEIPIIKKLKEAGEKVYPDVQKVIEYFEKLPITFYNELKILYSLKETPNNFLEALRANKESATICVYAYSSLLFNKYLSEYTKINGCVDEEFPLLLSTNQKDIDVYRKYLIEDKTENFLDSVRKLKFIYLTERKVSGRIHPRELNYSLFDGGVVLRFYLQKGSYATTFLANLFELYEDEFIPDWVSKERIDPLKLMGEKGIDEIKNIFKDNWI